MVAVTGRYSTVLCQIRGRGTGFRCRMERESRTLIFTAIASWHGCAELVLQFSYPLRRNVRGSCCDTVLERSWGHQRRSLDLDNTRCGRGPEHICRLHIRWSRVCLREHQNHHDRWTHHLCFHYWPRRRSNAWPTWIPLLEESGSYEAIHRRRQHRPIPRSFFDIGQCRLFIWWCRNGSSGRRRIWEPTAQHTKSCPPCILAYLVLLRPWLTCHWCPSPIQRVKTPKRYSRRFSWRSRFTVGHCHLPRQRTRSAINRQCCHSHLSNFICQCIPLHRIPISLRTCPKRTSTKIPIDMLSKASHFSCLLDGPASLTFSNQGRSILVRRHYRIHLPANLHVLLGGLPSRLSMVPKPYRHHCSPDLDVCFSRVHQIS